jgi:hypothetical protein
MLDLAFDVDLAKGLAFRSFENRPRLAGEKPKPVFSFFKKMLSVVVGNELICIAVRFERKLLSDES